MLASILPDGKLIIASHNKGKAAEIADLLAPYNIKVMTAADFNLPPPAETSDSYLGNARLKARATLAATGIPALADDSGFEVMAWGGKPGIHSARLAEEEGDYAKAMARIAAEVSQAHNASRQNRQCRMVAALLLACADGREFAAEGYANGTFVWPPRGDHGFGYDPVFQPDGHNKTFAEMDAPTKQSLSHRHQAMHQLLAAIRHAQ